MKTKVLLVAITLTTGFFFTSCEKEDTEKPKITNLEVGHNDTIHVGEGLHLDFYISDNEVFDYYRIVIHAEEEGHEHKSATEHDHWEIDSTFTEIHGLRANSDDPLRVHHHNILVPENAELGEYHFHLRVVDKSGNVAEIEKEVILAEEDDHDPDHDHDD